MPTSMEPPVRAGDGAPGAARRTVRALCLWQTPERLRDHLEELLRGEPRLELVFPESAAPDELVRLAPEAEVLIGWYPTPEVLAAAERLALFIHPGAGLERAVGALRAARRRREFLVVNSHGSSYLVAQHAVALLLALTNKVVPHHGWMAAGRWRTGDREGASVPLRQRTVGLVGYGAVNRTVHRFLAGFELEFAALRRRWPAQDDGFPTPLARHGPVDLRRFLERSDVLVAALPETAATRGMIGLEELRCLGRDGLVVNVGRGAVIDERGLYVALEQELIAGAAIDVWYDEEPAAGAGGERFPYRYPFHRLPNVVLSPHRGASPKDDLPRWDDVVENLRRFADGRLDLLNLVDLEEGY